MKIISRYVGNTVAAATAVVLIAFLGLELIFRIIDETENIGGNYTFYKVLVYEGLRTFSRIYDYMPLVCLIGCLTGLGALANTSELIVIRSAGISTFRLVLVSLKPALFFMIMAIFVSEEITPKVMQYSVAYRDFAMNEKSTINVRHGLWLRDGDDFVYINVVQPTGVLYGLNVFNFDKNQSLESILHAEKATFKDFDWALENVEITYFKNENGMPQSIRKETSENSHWKSQLKPELLNIVVVDPIDLKTLDLYNYVKYLKGQSLNSTEYELAFWQKIFYPLVIVSLVLIGISFVFGPLRQVSMGYRVFCGILIGIIFKTLQDIIGPVSILYGFPPMWAMLTPALLCAFLGMVLIFRVK